ncbi:MAG: riboflavin synthase [Balneolaceae bacterium]|nr:riboflavin synthase [Balneolaceae bacterium]
MFTGIMRETGQIESIIKLWIGGKEFIIKAPFVDELKVDQSISINGVCLTVTDINSQTFTVQVVEETLRKTNIGELTQGDRINLERSMTMDKLLDGHIVQGHVDTVGTITEIEKEGTDHLGRRSVPEKHRKTSIVGRGEACRHGWHQPDGSPRGTAPFYRGHHPLYLGAYQP